MLKMRKLGSRMSTATIWENARAKCACGASRGWLGAAFAAAAFGLPTPFPVTIGTTLLNAAS